MECNKEEALKAKVIAENFYKTKDFSKAKEYCLKAQELFPDLEGLQKLHVLVNVYYAHEHKINGEVDYYGILGVHPSADEESIRKQYRRMLLDIHPDKNKFDGAHGAFVIFSEAWEILKDKNERRAYDMKLHQASYNNLFNITTTYAPSVPSNPSSSFSSQGPSFRNQSYSSSFFSHDPSVPSQPCSSSFSSQDPSFPSQPYFSSFFPHDPSVPSQPYSSSFSSQDPSFSSQPYSSSFFSHDPSVPSQPGSSSFFSHVPTNMTFWDQFQYGRTTPEAASSQHTPSQQQPHHDPTPQTSSMHVPAASARNPAAKRKAVSQSRPKSKSGTETFWTGCNRCRIKYTFQKILVNENVQCPRCLQTFLAIEMSAPPAAAIKEPVLGHTNKGQGKVSNESDLGTTSSVKIRRKDEKTTQATASAVENKDENI